MNNFFETEIEAHLQRETFGVVALKMIATAGVAVAFVVLVSSLIIH